MIAEDVLNKSLKALELCNNDYSLDNYLDEYVEDSKIRAKVSSVLFSYFRYKLSVDFIINHFSNRKIKPKIYKVLSIATIQILYQTGIRPEVAVDVAVNHTKKCAGKSTAGFVNAVLRNIVRNIDELDNILLKASESVKINIPEYVLKRWNKFYTHEEVTKLKNIIKQPQNNIFYRIFKTFSIEPMIGSEIVTIDKIKSDFVFYKHFSGKEVIKSDILKDGQIYIQDPATSMATSNINFHGNGNILDACSAPGGKTIMLSELYPKSQIYAMDRSERRLFRVEQNIKNAGCNNVKTIASDILDAPFEDAYFDVVFLDVPCSNSGVLRKRPDALWKLNAERINDIIRLQRKMLDSANRLVKKGGTLVYSTCSIEADENKKQIETFLKNNTNYTLEFQKQLLPDMDNDGAFVAVMNKQ